MHTASLMNIQKGIIMDTAPHSASVSVPGVRGHVWLCVCAWLSRTETNKETFQGGGGFTYTGRQQKKAAGCITGERGQSVSFEFWFISLIIVSQTRQHCIQVDFV